MSVCLFEPWEGNDTKTKQRNADLCAPREWVRGLQPRRTHTTTCSLTLAPGKERHTQGEMLIRVPLGSVDSSHAGQNVTLSHYSRLQPLAKQLPAASLRHTKVPAWLAWNLDGGAT